MCLYLEVHALLPCSAWTCYFAWEGLTKGGIHSSWSPPPHRVALGTEGAQFVVKMSSG
jgi:hypothetical protein